jgi:molecular chaperone DnaK
METEINLPFITADASGPKHLQMKLTRAKLEQLTEDLIERTMEPCKQALKDAGLKTSDIDEVILVGGMTRMPAIQLKAAKFFGKEPHKGVNPDEVVGLGAGIQGGVLGGEVKDILLLDVTPLTLSIETLGGVATPLIERNTTIPTRKSQIFSTAADGQTQVEIHVVQGERPMAADNKSLGKFILDGIPPAPRGVPQIEVTFDIDANGILNVSAQDKATGREQRMQIIPSSGLADEEVERMVEDADKYREQDRKRKEQVEARNIADNTLYAAEKFLKEQGNSAPSNLRSDVESKITALRSVIESNDTGIIRQRTDELSQALQRMGAAMYQSAGPSTPPPGGESEPPEGGEEDVVEGEFSEA